MVNRSRPEVEGWGGVTVHMRTQGQRFLIFPPYRIHVDDRPKQRKTCAFTHRSISMSMVIKKHFKQTPINNLIFKLMTDDNFSFLLNKYLLVVMIISESFKTRNCLTSILDHPPRPIPEVTCKKGALSLILSSILPFH